MRTAAFTFFLFSTVMLHAQNMEMPSPQAVAKNKYTSLEMYSLKDTTEHVFAWYRFDGKGRMIYQKTLHSSDVKPYYTVYTYDKKGRLSTETDRSLDGKFIRSKAYSWLKDSVRIQSWYNDPADSTYLTLQYWLDPRNTVLRMVSYDKGGYKLSDMGGIFDKKRNLIGSYDSTAQNRIKNEYVFKKYRRTSTYDENGQLIHVVTLQCDTNGYYTALTDSLPTSKTAVHYVITRTYEAGMIVSSNGIRLTNSEQASWSSKYGSYHYNDPLIAPYAGAAQTLCYPLTLKYDVTGLIMSALVNNVCMPTDEAFPYTIFYRYK
jgi:hypothetical protein